MLFAANPHAFFKLADPLSQAERHYLTLRDLDHNEFIAQGVIAAAFGDREGAVGLLHQVFGQGLPFEIRWFRGLEPASLELDPLGDYEAFQS